MRIQSGTGSSLEDRNESRRKVHVILLAGGKGSRLCELTQETCKPAVGFGAEGCIIDYAIANVFNSGLRRMSILTQYKPDRLNAHIENRWSGLFARHGGSISICDGAAHGDFNGTADAVLKWAAKNHQDMDGADTIVVLAADHIYQLDLNEFIAVHQRDPAAMTLGALHVPVDDASAFGILECDADGRAVTFTEKPREARPCAQKKGHALASLGIYVFDRLHLSRLLDEGSRQHDDLDFGHHILPGETEAGRVRVFALPARADGEPYWRDVGTVQSFHAAHMELLENRNRLDPEWSVPVTGDRFSERDGRGLNRVALARDAIIASRRLESVVVARGARVGLHAQVSRSVIMADAQVGSGAVLSDCIVAPGTRIPPFFNLERYRDLLERSSSMHGDRIVLLTDALVARLTRRRPLMRQGRIPDRARTLPVAGRSLAMRGGMRP